MTTTFTREKALQDEIAQAVEGRLPGVEVLAVELLSPSRFCVYVDRPSGVDHALCEEVTRLLGPYREEYTIDVSSPGPERPLRTPSHFSRVLGRQVSVRTDPQIDGRSKFRGEVLSAGEDELTLAAGAEPVHIPYGSVVRANLIDEG